MSYHTMMVSCTVRGELVRDCVCVKDTAPCYAIDTFLEQHPEIQPVPIDTEFQVEVTD